MKNLLILVFMITFLYTGCSSKVQTYDSSVQKNEAAKAHRDLDNELKK